MDRNDRGHRTRIQTGGYGTGAAPYGYRRYGTTLVVDDYEAEIVRAIFRAYIRTKSAGRVVEHLQSQGVLTRRGNEWSRQAIFVILSNRTYRGRVTRTDMERQGRHQPIIEPALFYKANELRKSKGRVRAD